MISPVLLILLMLAGLGLRPLLAQHERRASLQAAIERHELARDRLAVAEAAAAARLAEASDSALAELLAERSVLDSLAQHAERERELLAERAGVQLR